MKTRMLAWRRGGLGAVIIVGTVGIALAIYTLRPQPDRDAQAPSGPAGAAARSAQGTTGIGTPVGESNGKDLGIPPEAMQTIVANDPPPPPLSAEDAAAVQNTDSILFLFAQPGVIIAQGTNTTASGPARLRTYQVEEVTLSAPATVQINDTVVTTEKFWRVILIGDHLPIMNATPSIWLDDTQLGYGKFTDGGGGIGVLVFNRAMLKEGATITLDYGGRVNLPEKLHFDIAP